MALFHCQLAAWLNRSRLPFTKLLPFPVLSLGALALSACTTMAIPAGPAPCLLAASLPVAPLALTGNTYHSYGDSITYGWLLPTPQDGYPYLLAKTLGLNVRDYAVPGSVSCDVPVKQVFAWGENATAASKMLYTLLIGTNDSTYNKPGWTAVFNQCHQSTVAWLAVPAESKVRANSATIRTSGAGAVDTTGGWNAWVTSTQGASISFPITLPTTQAIYIWTRIIDGDPGTYSYSVDGKVMGTEDTQTTPAIHSVSSLDNAMSLIRIPGVSGGNHVVNLTQTSSTGTMQIIAVGTPPAAGTPMPSVLIGDIPYTLNASNTGCSGAETPSLVYMALLQATVSMFHADGLQVAYVPTRKYMFATQSEMIDTQHPNQLGHSELSQAFQASLHQ